jgi:hypothetical protein
LLYSSTIERRMKKKRKRKRDLDERPATKKGQENSEKEK